MNFSVAHLVGWYGWDIKEGGGKEGQNMKEKGVEEFKTRKQPAVLRKDG